MSKPWEWTSGKEPPKGTRDYVIEVMRAAPTWIGFFESLPLREGGYRFREVFKLSMALHFPTREAAEEAALLFAATRRDPVFGHLRVIEHLWD